MKHSCKARVDQVIDAAINQGKLAHETRHTPINFPDSSKATALEAGLNE
jgi:hypothetical protein